MKRKHYRKTDPLTSKIAAHWAASDQRAADIVCATLNEHGPLPDYLIHELAKTDDPLMPYSPQRLRAGRLRLLDQGMIKCVKWGRSLFGRPTRVWALKD